jgi:hypothetical protein
MAQGACTCHRCLRCRTTSSATEGREGQGEAAAAIAADKSRKTPFREPRLTRAREEGRERVGGVIKKRGKLQTERERGPGALL